jgi:hypothetical protein
MSTQASNVIAPRSDFGDPKPNAVGRLAQVSHNNCVVHLDGASAPRLLWSGEDLLDVRLPAGTRVVYPKPTVPGLRDRKAAIQYAISHTEGMDPLVALLRPGMKIDRDRRYLAAASQDAAAGYPGIRSHGVAGTARLLRH